MLAQRVDSFRCDGIGFKDRVVYPADTVKNKSQTVP